MKYPFRMYGEIVEIYRYQITYTKGEEPNVQQVTQGFPTLEEAQAEGDRHGVTPEPLDTTAYAWMDGLTFSTRNDAMAAYDLGEEGYKAQVAAQEEEAHRLENAVDQLQKQVDAVAPMYSGTGYIPSAMESMLALSQFALAQVSDEETKLKVSGLYPDWTPGSYEVGNIYNTHSGVELDKSWEQTWEVHQAYDNNTYPDINPGDASWFAFNRPLHGKSPETARPWVKPSHGTTDTYKVGEYMIFTDGNTYKCKSDTNFSPVEYTQAWEAVS